jgi:hypothetical protein
MSVKTKKSMAKRFCLCIGSLEVPDRFESITAEPWRRSRRCPSPSPRTPAENTDRQAFKFRVEIGEYHGVVRVRRRDFQSLLLERCTLERWVGACYFQRTRFESIAEDATSAALDRGRVWRDQRAGFALALELVVKEGL